MTPSQATEFILPDFFAACPFALGRTNPHADTVIPESRAWINKHSPFVDRRREEFILSGLEGLAYHCVPWAGKEGFRTICDFQNLLFLVDELTDDMSGDDARVVLESFIRLLNDPIVQDESPVAQATKEFRSRIVANAVTQPVWFRRFVATCKSYADATGVEAEHREHKRVLDMETYTVLRRENSAIRCCLSINECVLGVNLPDAVFGDPTFLRMYLDAVDMIGWSNDVYSYNMEQSKGLAGNNIVTVLMQSLGLGLQAAVDRVGDIFSQKIEEYVRGRGALPSWGAAVDTDVERYFDMVDQWIIGNLEWSTETPCYLGSDHGEIRKTRRVVLRRIETRGE